MKKERVLLTRKDWRILKSLAKQGFIEWPVDRDSKGRPFSYVNDLKGWQFFDKKGQEYNYDGCFYPFVLKVINL